MDGGVLALARRRRRQDPLHLGHRRCAPGPRRANPGRLTLPLAPQPLQSGAALSPTPRARDRTPRTEPACKRRNPQPHLGPRATARAAGIDRSHIDTSDPDDHGLVLFDPHLDAWADQEAIVAFCERLARPELAPYTAQPAKAECPMAGFKGYRLQRNLTWPLPTQAAFIDKLREYLATPEGFDYTQRVRRGAACRQGAAARARNSRACPARTCSTRTGGSPNPHAPAPFCSLAPMRRAGRAIPKSPAAPRRWASPRRAA